MCKCVKCGSSSIEFQWVEDGTNLGTCKEQGKMSEFIRYVARAFDYQIVCKKEHLLKTCHIFKLKLCFCIWFAKILIFRSIFKEINNFL